MASLKRKMLVVKRDLEKMFHLKQLQSHMGLWIAICNNEQSTRPFLLMFCLFMAKNIFFRLIVACMYCHQWASAGKESACNARDPSSIPGSGSSHGEMIGYPLQ